MNIKVKPLVVATGLGLAIASGQVAASISWNFPNTLFEDDLIDFLYIDQGNDGIIDVGDVLVTPFEVNESAGISIGPEELTGVAAIQLITITNLDGGAAADDFVFGAYSGGLNEVLGLGSVDATVTGGEAGGAALLAMWVDETPDLNINASILPGAFSCNSLASCIDQASDGTIWQVAGIDGTDPDDYWVALNAQGNTNFIVTSEPSQGFGNFNAGLTILEDNTGQNLEEDAIACGVFCGPGGNGFVDELISGSIKGGAGMTDGLYADGAVATGDADLTKRRIPEPNILVLLAAGLLGLGVTRRKRRKT